MFMSTRFLLNNSKIYPKYSKYNKLWYDKYSNIKGQLKYRNS